MSTKNKDYFLLITLVSISFISVYFLPAILNRAIFIVILVAAFRTKFNYVYLVWFFIINDAPGRLFTASSFEAARIPLYPVTSGVSVTFQELFLILYLFKFLSLTRRPKFIFKKEFSGYIVFGIFVIIYSFLLGMNFNNIIQTFRIFLPWSLIFILPTYIDSREILVRVSLLLFPIVVLAFSSQVYSYITGNYFDNYLRGIEFRFLGVDEESISRSYSAVNITLFCIIQAFYLFFNRKAEVNQAYLGFIIFTGLFSILLTATRGWIIAFSQWRLLCPNG